MSRWARVLDGLPGRPRHAPTGECLSLARSASRLIHRYRLHKLHSHQYVLQEKVFPLRRGYLGISNVGHDHVSSLRLALWMAHLQPDLPPLRPSYRLPLYHL